MGRWYRVRIITCVWENFPQDECQFCPQLTTNTIKWLLRSNFCLYLTTISTSSFLHCFIIAPKYQYTITRRKSSNSRTSGFLWTNCHPRKSSWVCHPIKLLRQFFVMYEVFFTGNTLKREEQSIVNNKLIGPVQQQFEKNRQYLYNTMQCCIVLYSLWRN